MKNHKLIEEVQYSKLNFLKFLFEKHENKVLEHVPSKVLYTGSGRAALRIILEYLKSKRFLETNDQILVPLWMCQSVLYTMQRFCFPTISLNKNIKGILVYHQYGYPQNMDEICEYCDENNLFIIEDCANVYDSSYKRKQLGTYGLGSIFSFPKIFPSIYGGALTTNNTELYDFGKKRILESNKNLSHLTYGSRILYECLKDSFLKNQVSSFQEMSYTQTDSVLNIKDISLNIINKQLIDGAMKKRKENYQFVLNYFNDTPEYFEGLEREDIIPYIVPLFDEEKNLKVIEQKLNEINIKTGIYHFDINRNVLNPNFKKCLWIPIHQGINLKTMELICKTIKG